MAKYEKHFRGDFAQVLALIDRAVMEGSSSASLEDSSDMYCGMPAAPSGCTSGTAGAVATG